MSSVKDDYDHSLHKYASCKKEMRTNLIQSRLLFLDVDLVRGLRDLLALPGGDIEVLFTLLSSLFSKILSARPFEAGRFETAESTFSLFGSFIGFFSC